MAARSIACASLFLVLVVGLAGCALQRVEGSVSGGSTFSLANGARLEVPDGWEGAWANSNAPTAADVGLGPGVVQGLALFPTSHAERASISVYVYASDADTADELSRFEKLRVASQEGAVHASVFNLAVGEDASATAVLRRRLAGGYPVSLQAVIRKPGRRPLSFFAGLPRDSAALGSSAGDTKVAESILRYVDLQF